MNEPNDNIPRDAIQRKGESDSTPEFKASRDNLVLSIRGLLDDVEGRLARGETLGEYGVINDKRGITRTIIKDPSENAETNIMTKSTQPQGVYFYNDESTGERSLVVVSPDKVTQVKDNPLEQQITGPEAGYSNGGSTTLASFNETLQDNSYVGARVSSSGGLWLKKFDGGYHESFELGIGSDQLETVGLLWDQIQTDLVESS